MKNDYDSYAEERHERLTSGTEPAHRFAEKPMMKSMLPDLKNQKILMLGCGTGEEVELLKAAGAEPQNLTGIDLSEKSIEIAREIHPDANFLVGDMAELPFKNEYFDFVYSSLTVHYSPTPEKVYQEIYRILKPGGQFLFSVGHPIRWSSAYKTVDGVEFRILGCAKNDDSGETIGNYNTFAEHTHNYFAWGDNETLSFYVGPPSLHFKSLRKVGFEILDFTESRATEEAATIDPNYYEKNKEFPQFMAFLAKKRSS